MQVTEKTRIPHGPRNWEQVTKSAIAHHFRTVAGARLWSLKEFRKMSTIEQEASPRKRRFGEEFKRDAARLVAEEQYSFKAAAIAVGVSEQSLRAWR